jgi:hypothetical protein
MNISRIRGSNLKVVGSGLGIYVVLAVTLNSVIGPTLAKKSEAGPHSPPLATIMQYSDPPVAPPVNSELLLSHVESKPLTATVAVPKETTKDVITKKVTTKKVAMKKTTTEKATKKKVAMIGRRGGPARGSSSASTGTP